MVPVCTTCTTGFFSCRCVEVTYLVCGVFSSCLHACYLYDWRNWFFQLPLCGGHCTARGVFSTCLYACFLYDQGNWFFKLPFSGGHFVADGCSCFHSMLVWCTTEETGFFSCRRWEISFFVVGVSFSFSQHACCL